MDSFAVSLQSGSTNYESNSTPVPGIVNQSRNCATGKSLDFNERESQNCDNATRASICAGGAKSVGPAVAKSTISVSASVKIAG
jgi:hypothetical protein